MLRSTDVQAAKKISEFLSPNGMWMVAVFCEPSDYCYIGVKELAVKNSKFKVAAKFKKDSRFIIQSTANILWSPNGKNFIFDGLDSNDDLMTTIIVIYNIGAKKIKTIENSNIDTLPILKGKFFSYKVIDQIVDNSRKCPNQVLYKGRNVVRDFSGNLIKQTPYERCGEGAG